MRKTKKTKINRKRMILTMEIVTVVLFIVTAAYLITMNNLKEDADVSTGKSETSQHEVLQADDFNQNEIGLDDWKAYENDKIKFNYPQEWTLEERIGDTSKSGMKCSFFSFKKDGKEVFRLGFKNRNEDLHLGNPPEISNEDFVEKDNVNIGEKDIKKYLHTSYKDIWYGDETDKHPGFFYLNNCEVFASAIYSAQSESDKLLSSLMIK